MSNTLRTLLIDDEMHSLESLEIEIKTHCPRLEVIGLSQGAKQGLQAIEKHKPDLVFLDIDMPDMNGFEMLEHVKDPAFDVIFATAYDEYAVRAIKVSAMDYLLKPIDPADLEKAVERVFDKRDATDASKRLDVLLTNLESADRGFKKIAIPTSTGLDLVDTSDIITCEADGGYTRIITTDGNSYLVSRTLKEISELLSGPTFFRTHQSYLVNLDHAKKYVKGAGGYLVMSNSSTAQVARARKDALMTFILKKGT